MVKGSKVTVAIRPEFIDSLTTVTGDEFNVIEGKVARADFVGDSIACQIAWGNQLLHVKLPSTSDVARGDKIFLRVNPQYCRVFCGPCA